MQRHILITLFCCNYRRGTKVMLCANHRPILNDVTHAELQLLLYKASQISPTIANAISTGKLTCFSSGQASPCLDLARLNKVIIYICLNKALKYLSVIHFENYTHHLERLEEVD